MKKISLITATLISLHSATFTENITNLSFSPNSNGYANSNSVSFSWTPPTITGSSLDGYYYKIDTTSNTLVGVGDTTISSSAQTFNTTLSDNSSGYYLHIAPFAQDGDIAGTTHLGPIKVDATTPSVSFSPDGGTSNFTAITLTLTASESGATIYYTLDGTTPTTSSTEYSNPLSLGVSKSVKVLLKDLAGNQSGVTQKDFTINTPLKFQSLSNNGAVAQIATYNATAYTTLALNANSAITRYQYKIDSGNYQIINSLSSINISTLNEGSHTITLLAGDTNSWQSESEAYSVSFSIDNTRPIVTADTLFSQSGNSVSINTNLSDVSSVYYTLDGTTPTKSSTLYSSAINISANTTIKAIGVDKAGNESSLVQKSFTYTATTTSSGGGSGGSSTSSSSNSTDIASTTISIPQTATTTTEGDTQVITTESKTLDDGSISMTNTKVLNNGSTTSNIEITLGGKKIVTIIEAPNGTNIVIGEDGTIQNTLVVNETKSEIVASNSGEVEVTLNTIDAKKLTFKTSKGSNVKLQQDGTITATNEIDSTIGKLNIIIEAKPNGELTATSTSNSGKSYKITVPNSAKEKNIEVINSALRAIFKVIDTNNFVLSSGKTLKSVTIEGENIEIQPISSWQKYEQNQYFDETRSIKLLLGQASLIVDGKEIEMEKGVEYLLPPSEFTPIIENKNSNEIFINGELQLKKGWNLVASPIDEQIEDTSIFETFSDIYTYSENWEHNPKNLEVGFGFWINMSEDKNITFNGNEYNPNLNNLTSWQLLGTGKDLSSINGIVWTFQNSEWFKNPTSIYRGQGFWVKENDIKITNGWNLVSNPKLEVVSSTIFTKAEEIYAFRDNSWVKNPTEISPLEGIWIKSTSYQGFDLESISSDDFNYTSNSNWQLLGTPTNINSSKVYSEVGCETIWAYDENWYEIENNQEIKGGIGFWVK